MPTLHEVLCRSGLAINDRESFEPVLGSGLGTAFSFILLIAVSLALVTAPVVRAMYRRRVTRLMRFEQVGMGATTTTPFASADTADDASGASRCPELVTENEVVAAAAQRQRRIVRGTTLALVIFALGAVVMARMLGSTWGDASMLLVIAGVTAGAPLFVNIRPYASGRTTVFTLGMLLSGFLASDVLLATPGSSSVESVVGAGVAALVLFLGLIHRTLRPLVLPLTILFSSLLVAFVVPLLVGALVPDCQAVLGAPERLNDFLSASLIVSPLIAMAIMLAFRGLDLLARWQMRGVADEISVVVAFALVLMACLLTWGMADSRGIQPSTGVLLATGLWAVSPCLAYFNAAAAPRRATRGHALLVLRVFAKAGRPQKLLDRVQAQWRLIGPVRQIGGPDLAPLNMNLLQSSMFLAGSLHELFVPATLSWQDLERRLRNAPGRDGRWGIDEVFCFNTAWQQTVDQLMTMSDSILIDVRGVTAARTGIRDELMLIAQGDRLTRTLAVGDQHTDWDYVDNVIRSTAGADAQSLIRVTEGEQDERAFVVQLAHMAVRARRAPDTW